MSQWCRRRQQKISPLILIAAVLAVVLVAAIIVLVGLKKEDPSQTQPQSGNVNVELNDTAPIDLGQDLYIESVGAYTGIYMEDGTNEVVSGIMMAIFENKSTQDLQLARFSLEYSDFTAEFEVTNLPAGQKVVVLEKNRRQEAGKPTSAKTTAVWFFPEKMTLMEGTLELGGQDGGISIKNVSGKDISGDVWVYYKYSATDIFYGGITFRAKHTGGLKAGEAVLIPAGHYQPNSAKLVWATVGP